MAMKDTQNVFLLNSMRLLTFTHFVFNCTYACNNLSQFFDIFALKTRENYKKIRLFF